MSTRSPKPRRSSKSPGAHKRRMTELDKDRNSRGKEIAAEKGLVWTKDVPTEGKNYEPVLRDDSHMAKQEVGFLDIGKAEPTHAYDVGGEWKLLYKKPGEDGSDKPAGPGITPRVSPDTTPKTSPKIAPKKVPKASPKPKKKPPKPMTIFVRNYDGLTFTLDNVKPHDKIDDIHNRIEDEHHIPREHQRLRLGRQPLKNPDRTLKECHIEDQTTLDLDPMEIHVVEPYGNKKHTLIVEPTETIDEVKDKVEDKTGIPKKDQILTFGGRPLDKNRKTLEDYGIQHNDTLNLEPMEIKVRAPDGRIAELQVRPDDTIPDIKDQVKEKLGIPPKDQRPTFKNRALPDNSTLKDNNIRHGDTIDLQPMEIKVRNHDGRTTKLTVDPDDTIPDIKDQVEEKLGIPPEDQRPTFKNKPLPDNSTLRDNRIKHGDVIDLQPMKIKVRAPDGRVADLIVDPDDTIPDIKDQVEKKLGIPPEEQRPIFDGKPLPDNSTLRDNGIKHGDVVDLEPMEINVRNHDGRTTKLSVSPEDTIDKIKKRVKKNLGIKPEDQRPTFNGSPLPNDSTLKDNDICHGDTIDLEPMEIKVRAPDGQTTKLLVDPDDTIDEIKERVEPELGIPADEQRPTFKNKALKDGTTLRDNKIRHGDTIDLEPMEIKVRAPDGRIAELQVRPDDTIPDIKDQVKEKLGIPPKDQRPTFKNRALPDNSTLKDNNIRHGDTIDLQPMEIKVRNHDGRTTKLTVDPDDTIPDIKDQVEEKLGIPPEDQRPTFKNKPLPDNSTLRDNKIKHGDVIDLQPMKIKVRAPDGRVADLIVDPDDTIPDIKDQVEKKFGIPPEDQRPTFNNMPLPDNSTLRDNGIKHGDVVDLEPMKIKVRAPDGRIADLTVDPNDTIDDVKKQVKKQLGIPTKDQRPAFNDKPLPDNSTLNQNNIRHGDVIDLQPMEIYVIDLDGKKGTYEVDPSDSIGDLKSRVEDKTGVDRDNQRLTFKGVLLEENNNTLSDVGIKHKDTLKLEPWKVHVRLPGGKKITFDVNPKTTTPNDLKNKIKQQEGIIPKKQILKLKGKELDDPTNLEDNGVKHNDVIDLRMTPPPVQLKAPDVDKRDFKRPINPDRYGNVTVTTFKTRYDGEPGESFIDGVINKETTEFKWSSELRSGQ